MLKDALYAQGLSHEIGGRKVGVIEGWEGFEGILQHFFFLHRWFGGIILQYIFFEQRQRTIQQCMCIDIHALYISQVFFA